MTVFVGNGEALGSRRRELARQLRRIARSEILPHRILCGRTISQGNVLGFPRHCHLRIVGLRPEILHEPRHLDHGRREHQIRQISADPIARIGRADRRRSDRADDFQIISRILPLLI